MKSKLFRKALGKYGLACCLAVLTGQIHAQDFTAPREQEPAPAKVEVENLAYVRTWFMTKPHAPVDLIATIEGKPDETLVQKPYAYYYGGYRGLPPGATTVAIYPLGKRESAINQESTKFSKGRFYTVLVRPDGKKYKMEILDDTLRDPLPPDDGDPNTPEPVMPIRHQFRIYQYLDDQPVAVNVPELSLSKEMKPGEVEKWLDVQAGPISISMTYKDEQGRESTASTDANLKDTASCSLIIMRDVYGRFTARLVPNGILE